MAEGTAEFSLQVIASNRVFYSDKAQQLIVECGNGKVGLLAHHEAVILATVPGELSIQKRDGKWIHVVAGNGSLVFANNRCTVLVDTCETQEELDRRRAQEALERAQERMRQKQSIREYNLTQAAMARALSRLKFKDKYN
ncbi:MAG: ATP synthase F1 subunit epsilon [Eubacteriales bacterium]|nr:ATP synthase F1 subunit epsilon [Eubacteriales bacterium]